MKMQHQKQVQISRIESWTLLKHGDDQTYLCRFYGEPELPRMFFSFQIVFFGHVSLQLYWKCTPQRAFAREFCESFLRNLLSFFDDFRGDVSGLIGLILFNLKKEIWRRSLKIAPLDGCFWHIFLLQLRVLSKFLLSFSGFIGKL